MTEGNSRVVEGNQYGLHENLEKIVRRHLLHEWQKPFATHSIEAFQRADSFYSKAGRSLILDSGCGTGDSSRKLARKFPDHTVIGIDRSQSRLARERTEPSPDNLLLLRSDLSDFLRLACDAGWRPVQNYLLYPNPWPKAAHFGRRWHGSPVFPAIIKLGGRLILRCNWKIYADEFAAALSVAGISAEVKRLHPDNEFLSPFEKKYVRSGHELYELRVDLDS